MSHTIHKYSSNTIFDCLGRLPSVFYDKKVLLTLDAIVSRGDKLCIAFSGGPDSVFLLLHVLYLCKEQGYTINNACLIAHYMHHVRIDDTIDWQFMKENCIGVYPFIAVGYLGKDYREASLRNERWRWMCEVAEIMNSKTVVTGHNMTDRIETSILNGVRGSGLQGWNGMDVYTLKKECRIIRPLLHLSKDTVLEKLESWQCPYLYDWTNTEETISERNRIRKKRIEMFSQQGVYSTHRWSTFYQLLEKENTMDGVGYSECTIHPGWGEGVLLKICVNNETSLKQTLNALNVLFIFDSSYEEQRKTLKKSTGLHYLSIGSHWLFKTNGDIYYTTLGKKFRKRNIVGRSIKNTLFDEGAPSRRFPGVEDTYNGKSLARWMSGNNIPIFRRDWLPVQGKTPIVENVYPIENIVW